MRTFETPEPIRLSIAFGAGQITVSATDTDQTTVELEPLRDDESARELVASSTIEQRRGEVVVTVPRHSSGFFGRKSALRLAVTVPSGSELQVRTESADLDAVGEFAEVSLSTGSGDARVDTITADALVRSGSGDLSIERVFGSLQAKSGSGDIRVRQAVSAVTISTGSGDIYLDHTVEDVDLNTASGDIVVQEAGGGVKANTASGDVLLSRVHRRQLLVNTASGDVHVGVAAGTAAWLEVGTLTGDVHSGLDGTDQPGEHEQTVHVHVNTASGDITLVRA